MVSINVNYLENFNIKTNFNKYTVVIKRMDVIKSNSTYWNLMKMNM